MLLTMQLMHAGVLNTPTKLNELTSSVMQHPKPRKPNSKC